MARQKAPTAKPTARGSTSSASGSRPWISNSLSQPLVCASPSSISVAVPLLPNTIRPTRMGTSSRISRMTITGPTRPVVPVCASQ